MATIGQSLTSPELGWKRIDETNANIIYNGNFTSNNLVGTYGGTYKSIEDNTKNNSIEFYIKSQRLRLICYADNVNPYSNNINIEVDGVVYNATLSIGIKRYQVLVADINISGYKTHKVKITDKSITGRGLNLDAIDIDEGGEIISKNTYLQTVNSIKGMFDGCISLTYDYKIPSYINNATELYKNCTSISHATSNWDDVYDNGLIANNCYSGCTGITHIDDVLVANDYSDGLDEIPIAWGGNGLYKENTGIYRVFIPSDNYTFTLNDATYLMDDGKIKWGDGTTTTGVLSHTYAMAGEYIIKGKIQLQYQGVTPCLSMRDCCTEVIQYPTLGNTYGAFLGMSKVAKINISGNKLTSANGIDSCFNFCSSLSEIIGLETWDVSNITNFRGVFSGTKITNSSFNISNWNLNKATNLGGLFHGCAMLVNLPITNIPDTVTNISEMYRGCTSLTNVDGMTFGSGITNCTDWITGCGSLVSANNVTIKSNYVAQNIFKNNITITSSNDVLLSNVTDISNMYSGCTKLVNCGFKDLTNSTLITTNAFPSTLTTITLNGTYNRTAIQNILKSCPWQINVVYGDTIPTTLTTKDINMNKSSETQFTNLLEGSSKTLEVYGNTIQNLVTNPDNTEETCRYIYSGSGESFAINDTVDSKIRIDEIQGNTIQNPNNLSDIQSVGVSVANPNLFEDAICDKFTKETVNGVEWYKATGSAFSNSSFSISSKLNFETNTQYTISSQVLNPNNLSHYILRVEYTDGSWSYLSFPDSQTKHTTLANKTVSKIFTERSGTLHFYIRNIQIQKGTVATPYYPKGQELFKIDVLSGNVGATQTSTKSIYLPCQLQGLGANKDRLYWDKSKSKWCIEKVVKIVGTTITNQTPQIIELPYTNQDLLELNTYPTQTNISSNAGINPNLVINSAGVSRDAMLKPSTKYTVSYTTDKDVEIDLGGTKINSLATETKKLITTPATLGHGEVRFANTNAKLKNISVVEGDYMAEDDFNYFEGIQSVGEYDSASGKYKVEVKTESDLTGLKYDSFQGTAMKIGRNKYRVESKNGIWTNHVFKTTDLYVKTSSQYTLYARVTSKNITDSSVRWVFNYASTSNSKPSNFNVGELQTITLNVQPIVTSGLNITGVQFDSNAQDGQFVEYEMWIKEDIFVNTKTFLLDEPLRKIVPTYGGTQYNYTDKLYWDSNKGHYCVDRNVGYFYVDNFVVNNFINLGSEKKEFAYGGQIDYGMVYGKSNYISYPLATTGYSGGSPPYINPTTPYAFATYSNGLTSVYYSGGALTFNTENVGLINSWLNGRRAICYVPLASPVVQDLPTYNQNVGLLRIWQDKTVIDTSNIIKPSKVKFVVKDIT